MRAAWTWFWRSERLFHGALGALMALGHAPFGLWPVSLVALGLLAFRFQTVARPFWAGWWLGAGYFAVSLHWIVEPFLVDIPRHGWMAPFALVAVSGGFALFWGAAYRLATVLRLGAWGWAVAMAAAELARGYVLTGFPWAHWSYVWVDTPLLQLTAWIGSHGVGLAVALSAAGAAALGRSRWALFASAPFLVLLGLGIWAELRTPAEARAAGPVVRLIQPNAPQHQKWDPAYLQLFFERQIALTQAPSELRTSPEIIIWPEVAVPFHLEHGARELAFVSEAAAGATVVLGIHSRPADQTYNAVAVIAPGGTVTETYRKHHLVPFGEYVPFAPLLSRLGVGALGEGALAGFGRGSGATTLDLGALGRVIPLVCYEAVFPQHIRVPGPRADWILQVTNDAWFGNFSGPYQHLDQARFRAVEQGLPLVRVANTGVSAVIDARGSVVGSLPLNVQGKLDMRVPGALSPTLYSRTGDLPLGLLLAGLICAGMIRILTIKRL